MDRALLALTLVLCGTALHAGCSGSHLREPDGGRPPRPPVPPTPEPAETPAPDRCWTGTAVTCDCGPSTEGLRYCVESAWSEECTCPPPVDSADAGAPSTDDCSSRDDEWCDGSDNDCDGAIDEGHPCADPTIVNTLHFAGDAYGVVIGDEATMLIPLGDETRSPLVLERAAGSLRAVTASVDGSVLYKRPGASFYELRSDGPDREVPTPPCFGEVRWAQRDGSGRPYYHCGDTIRRGSGELLGEGFASMVPLAVTSSGSVVLSDPMNVVWVMDDVGGPRRADDAGSWTGDLGGGGQHTTAVGDSVFFARHRIYRDATREELVVSRVDASDGAQRLVRRVPIHPHPRSWLALPDGRVLAVYGEPGGGLGTMVIDYPADGVPTVVSRTRDSGARIVHLLAVHH